MSIPRRLRATTIRRGLAAFVVYLAITALPGALVGVVLYSDYRQYQARQLEAVRWAPFVTPGVGAICDDGWVSYSTGSGTCSWHGGVKMWASDVFRLTYGTWWDENFRLLAGLALFWFLGAVCSVRLGLHPVEPVRYLRA